MAPNPKLLPTMLVAGTLALGSVAAADVLHVPASYSTIQQAINAASDGDEIVVAAGTYHEAIDFMAKSISLRSSDGRESTLIDATGYGTAAVNIENCPGVAQIIGFTITGGVGNPFLGTRNYGGGIHIDSCRGDVIDCVVTQNHADAGAGIAYCSGWGTIESCLISNNTATGSSYHAGAGVHVYQGPVTIKETEFRDNSALGGCRGGGVAGHMAEITIHDSVFSGNSSYAGGAILAWHTQVDLRNVTMADNIAVTSGGAIFAMYSSSSVTLSNSVLWRNLGGSIDVEIAPAGGASVIPTNCIVRKGFPGTNVIDADPLFQEDCYRLTMASPARDAGLNAAVESDFDLDGNPRIAAASSAESTAIVDMGAYELQPSDDPEPSEACPGDANGDDIVGLADLLQVIAGWGGCESCESCAADFNDDCIIAVDDLLTVIDQWGESCN